VSRFLEDSGNQLDLGAICARVEVIANARAIDVTNVRLQEAFGEGTGNVPEMKHQVRPLAGHGLRR
jgi:hypothetical protein